MRLSLLLMHAPRHFASYHHAYHGYHYHSHAGIVAGFGSMLIHAVVYGVVSHLIGELFRGHSLIGSLGIGAVLLGIAFIAFAVFRRGRYA